MYQAPAKIRRRWFSYGMRTMFFAITALAVALAWVAYEQRESQHERRIAQMVTESGGIVGFRGLFDPLIAPFYPESEEISLWSRRALSIPFGAKVRQVDLSGGDLLPLAELHHLEILYYTATSESELSALARLRSLKFLSLSGSVSDLSPLAELTALKWITCTDTQVSNVSALAGLENLEIIWLDDTQVSDLLPLARLKHLRQLSFERTQVADLSPLAELMELRELYLNDTQVRDLSPLVGLKNLETIRLDHTQVSDLSPLAGLKNLTALTAKHNQISEVQVKLIEKSLPNCDVQILPY